MSDMEQTEWNTEQRILKFKIYVYGHGIDTSRSHSYCVDDTQNVTVHVGEVLVDISSITFKELRIKIQYNKSNDMDKRSLLFQEVLFIMDKLPNIYNRDKNELRKYLFGFVRKGNNELKIVGNNQEDQSIEMFLDRYDFFARNLMIIPLSQISI